MRNWYKSAPMKGILLVLEHILAVTAVICLVFVLAYPGQEYGKNIGDLSKADYQDTKGFENNVISMVYDSFGQIDSQRNLETKGKYNPDKVVDIEEYAESRKISGENVSGIAYRLGDLKNWADTFDEYEGNVIVCQKKDGTFEYYTLDAFMKQVQENKFQVLDEEEYGYLEQLQEGSLGRGSYGEEIQVVDANHNTVYVDCWNMYNAVNEEAVTVDGKSLVGIGNENPKWNWNLSHAYELLRETLMGIRDEFKRYETLKYNWAEGNTNLTYLFADFNSGEIYSNNSQYSDINKVSQYEEEMKQFGKYVIIAPKLADFATNFDMEAEQWCKSQILGTNDYKYMIAVDTEYPIQDVFYAQNKMFEEYAPIINKVIVLGIISIAGFFILLFWLTVVAGRTTEGEGVKLVWIDRLKTEIGLAAIIAIWACVIAVVAESIGTGTWGYYTESHIGDISQYSNFYYYDIMPGVDEFILVGIVTAICCSCFFIGYLSFVRRIKAKTLWKNSLTRWLLGSLRKFFRYRSCTFKVTAQVLGFIIVHWIAIGTMGEGGWMVVTFVVEAVALYLTIDGAITKQKLKKGICQIAGGNVGYQIPLRGLKGDSLDMAIHINRIGEGLSKAVEQSLKDERLKTDLITNVSHDIKTPLTSIINYVDLLKRENIDDPKIQGYLDILETKAQRLKHLTEDVVEASKISSGNITMEYMNIDFVEMINQTTGEFNEKFEKRNLQVVLNVPDHPVVIRSDGRRMWRVIENIYNNAAKYALEGTRVYADLIEKEHTVEFSLKNISEQPLNISADELTERFIRGDVSRSTEGSGLGLSIAQNLTKMQGGKFNLYLDGDLFKVTIVFPKVK